MVVWWWYCGVDVVVVEWLWGEVLEWWALTLPPSPSSMAPSAAPSSPGSSAATAAATRSKDSSRFTLETWRRRGRGRGMRKGRWRRG